MSSFIELAIANKDVFTTIVTLWVFIIMVIPLIKKQNKDISNSMVRISDTLDNFKVSFQKHLVDDSREQTLIFDKLEEHRKEANRQFRIIADNSTKRVLSQEQTIDLLKTQMWYVTWKKLDFIKWIILNNHIDWNRVKVKQKVTNWLLALSDEYMSKFAWYKTPIWDLWKWLNENFSENGVWELVDEIVDIIYKEYDWLESDNTLNKINEIAMIMKTLQVWLANKLRWDITNY